MENKFLSPISIFATALLTTSCAADNIQNAAETPPSSNQTEQVQTPKPKKLCNRLAPEVAAFREEIESVVMKVNFDSDSSVRRSFANSGIQGKIIFASAPASFTRESDRFRVKNSSALFDLYSGTKVQIGYNNQPYGKVIQGNAYKNLLGKVDENKPSLYFDNVDQGREQGESKNIIEIRLGTERDECPGISSIKK